MKGVNNVNNLNGKDWLKNAVNFWFFENDNVNEIYDRFESVCYKNRMNTGVLKNIDKIEVNESDFSFNYVKRFDDIEDALKVVALGSYNSYHIIYFEDELIDSCLVSSVFTTSLNFDGIEYRGKIIVNIKNTNIVKYALMFLNRRTEPKDITIRGINKINYIYKPIYIIDSKSKIDKIGLKHPAPFSYIDINKMAQIENIQNKTILDPFLGVGSTIIGTYKNNRNIGIELNQQYVDLIDERFKFLGLGDEINENTVIICGDSLQEVNNINENIDCVITSPPYFNILKNKTSGVRTDNSQTRQGIEYYSDDENDVGNIENYDAYIETMVNLFNEIKEKMNYSGDIYLIISDFTVNKKERDVHSDFVNSICNAGYVYNGTSYILQNQKAIYPFGYPYKIVLNHIYQYIVRFQVKNEH